MARIGFAARGLHHLPHEEPQHLGSAGSVLLHLHGVAGQYLLYDGGKLVRVAHLREATALYQFIDVAAFRP